MAALPLRNGESLTVRVRTDGGGASSSGAGGPLAAPQPAPGASSAAGAAAAASAPPAPAAPASGGASAGGPAPATALGNFSSRSGSAAQQSGGASVPAGPLPVLPQHSAPQPSGELHYSYQCECQFEGKLPSLPQFAFQDACHSVLGAWSVNDNGMRMPFLMKLSASDVIMAHLQLIALPMNMLPS